jgi:hypothetical protein
MTAANSISRVADPVGRHPIACKYERHPGIDVAFGHKDPIVYVPSGDAGSPPRIFRPTLHPN